jgi:hypothetical protein
MILTIYLDGTSKRINRLTSIIGRIIKIRCKKSVYSYSLEIDVFSQ